MVNSSVSASRTKRRRLTGSVEPAPEEAPEPAAENRTAAALQFALTAIFLVALLVRLPDVWRPVDGTVREILMGMMLRKIVPERP